jgi:FMN-dependent NADH-azoreductase
MRTLLQLNTSLYSGQGQSSRLAGEFVAAWLRRHPADRVLRRDLAEQPVPHLDAETFQAFGTAAESRTPAQRAAVADSDALIAELKVADVIVLGVPMYNFGVPSTLKAYFDHVARAGVTFRYTASGPEGLLKNKKAYVFATRGGRYHGTPQDSQSDYLRQFLGFLGIRDIEFIYAEGLAMGEHQRDGALADAGAQIQRLAA